MTTTPEKRPRDERTRIRTRHELEATTQKKKTRDNRQLTLAPAQRFPMALIIRHTVVRVADLNDVAVECDKEHDVEGVLLLFRRVALVLIRAGSANFDLAAIDRQANVVVANPFEARLILWQVLKSVVGHGSAPQATLLGVLRRRRRQVQRNKCVFQRRNATPDVSVQVARVDVEHSFHDVFGVVDTHEVERDEKDELVAE